MMSPKQLEEWSLHAGRVLYGDLMYSGYPQKHCAPIWTRLIRCVEGQRFEEDDIFRTGSRNLANRIQHASALPSTKFPTSLTHFFFCNTKFKQKSYTNAMLRRAPTSITLTHEDVASYEDRRHNRQLQENVNRNTNTSTHYANKMQVTSPKKGVQDRVDPNDELKPLPGDRARVRSGVGGAGGVGREERIMGR